MQENLHKDVEVNLIGRAESYLFNGRKTKAGISLILIPTKTFYSLLRRCKMLLLHKGLSFIHLINASLLRIDTLFHVTTRLPRDLISLLFLLNTHQSKGIRVRSLIPKNNLKEKFECFFKVQSSWKLLLIHGCDNQIHISANSLSDNQALYLQFLLLYIFIFLYVCWIQCLMHQQSTLIAIRGRGLYEKLIGELFVLESFTSAWALRAGIGKAVSQMW